MQHINTEALARLVDEPPNPEEERHLGHCTVCQAELDALCAQTEALRELPFLAPPAGGWTTLRERLAEEKLLARPRTRRIGRLQPLLRLAASLALFAAGGLVGAAAMRSSGDGGFDVASVADREITDAAFTGGISGLAEPQEVREATERLREAEAAYLAALTRYQELTDPEDATADPLTPLGGARGNCADHAGGARRGTRRPGNQRLSPGRGRAAGCDAASDRPPIRRRMVLMWRCGQTIGNC